MVTKVERKGISATQYRAQKAFVQSTVTVTPIPNAAGNYVWSDTKIGDDFPSWKEYIRARRNATTNYALTVRKAYRLNGSAGVTYTNNQGQLHINDWWGHPQNISWGVVSDPSGYSDSQAEQAARQRFMSKYREKRTAFQSGIFLGELSKTVQMLRNPASALRNGIDRYYRDVKKRLNRSKHKKRVIQDTWLEYVYGWSPLIKDVEDLARLGTAHPAAVFQPIKAGSRDVKMSEVIRTDNTAPPGLRVNYTRFSRGFVDCTYKGAIGARNQPPGFPEQLGLSWSNVLPTVWELIPYSFLVDYFTNVGKVIEGISTGKIRLSWGCRNVWRVNESYIANGTFDHAYAWAQRPSGAVKYSGYANLDGPLESRSTYARSPVSSVTFGLSDFDFKLPGSGTKWLNIAALARLKQ